MDPIALIVWGPEVAAELAGNREEAEQSREVIAELRSGTRATISSLDGITQALSTSGTSIVEAIQGSTDVIAEMIASGFQAVWLQLEAIGNRLARIEEAVVNPRLTRANESFRIGVNAFASGTRTGEGFWFDDALDEFSTCLEEYKYHYQAHFYLGRIHMEHKADTDRALAEFADAARYSLDADPASSAVSRTVASRIHWSLQKNEEALEEAVKATQLDPDLAVAYLQSAIARARLPNPDAGACLSDLNHALALDPSLYYSLIADPGLSTLAEVRVDLSERYQKATEKAAIAVEMATRMLTAVEDATQQLRVLTRDWDKVLSASFQFDFLPKAPTHVAMPEDIWTYSDEKTTWDDVRDWLHAEAHRPATRRYEDLLPIPIEVAGLLAATQRAAALKADVLSKKQGDLESCIIPGGYQRKRISRSAKRRLRESLYRLENEFRRIRLRDQEILELSSSYMESPDVVRALERQINTLEHLLTQEPDSFMPRLEEKGALERRREWILSARTK